MSWNLKMDSFEFPAHDRFLDRGADLARLEDWWAGAERNALALYGRRRVGKSWLFREFAHGKLALLLVADRRAEAPQLERFADRLTNLLGLRPALGNLAALFEALYTLAAGQKALVVIDEFPYLLPSREREREEVLTAVQSVMEDRDASQLKLILCGSYIAQMERLLKGPLRGRLTPLLVEPLGFVEAQSFIDASAAAVERIERYSVSGGMSLYLDELGRGGSLTERIRTRVLDPRGPLFNDPREVLEEELRTPGVYYSILEELSTGKKAVGDLAAALGRRTTDLQGYLDALRDMRVVSRSAPVTALEDERGHRYALADDYMRFWFRFVFPFQEELKTGLSGATLYREEVAPALSDHISPTFEALCREWVLRTGRATRVGTWWGNALNEYRREGSRQTEEIDVVGVRRSSVAVVGECKWRNSQVGVDVLEELDAYKIPALRQAKARLAKNLSIVLFSKSGFSRRLVQVAEERDDLSLIRVDQLVGDLIES
jgi:AAA+ ATPase superfamily predicted ATPase